MENKNLQEQLKKLHVKPLSAKEQDCVWENIRMSISPESSVTKKAKRGTFLRKAVAVTLIFGLTTGTAFAADSAKPGDTLFALDRALENLQLSIASDKKKDQLQVKFALERVSEVKDILEEVSVQPTNTSIKTAAPETTPEETQKEAAPEESASPAPEESSTPTQDDNLPQTDTETKTPENTVQQEQAPLSLPQTDVASAANATPTDVATPEEKADDENTDTSDSKPAEDAQKSTLEKTPENVDLLTEINTTNLSDGDKKRIELALGTALTFLGDVKGELAEQGNDGAVSYIDFMLEQLNEDIETLPSNITFEVDLSTTKEKVRFEVTSDKEKPKVQIEIEEDEKEPAKETEESDIETAPVETKKSKTPTKKLEIKDGSLSIKEEAEETPENQPAEKSGNTEEPSNTESEAPSKDEEVEGVDKESAEERSGTESDEKEEQEPEEDSTTTVKVIIKKLENHFELSVTDTDAKIHDIIDEYTQQKEKEEEEEA